jgi:hypothetical protein
MSGLKPKGGAGACLSVRAHTGLAFEGMPSRPEAEIAPSSPAICLRSYVVEFESILTLGEQSRPLRPPKKPLRTDCLAA